MPIVGIAFFTSPNSDFMPKLTSYWIYSQKLCFFTYPYFLVLLRATQNSSYLKFVIFYARYFSITAT